MVAFGKILIVWVLWALGHVDKLDHRRFAEGPKKNRVGRGLKPSSSPAPKAQVEHPDGPWDSSARKMVISTASFNVHKKSPLLFHRFGIRDGDLLKS